jgi:hypothetical protein
LSSAQKESDMEVLLAPSAHIFSFQFISNSIALTGCTCRHRQRSGTRPSFLSFLFLVVFILFFHYLLFYQIINGCFVFFMQPHKKKLMIIFHGFGFLKKKKLVWKIVGFFLTLIIENRYSLINQRCIVFFKKLMTITLKQNKWLIIIKINYQIENNKIS